MLAAVLHAPRDLRVEQVPTPEPGPGEVVLDIEATTLCGTDLRLISGAKTSGVRPGVVMGHEIAGRVAALGAGVTGLSIGDQATVSIVVSCHRCRACLDDREHLCENLRLIGYGIDGGFAERMLVPADAVTSGNVVVTPHEIPATTLALAEPLSCVLNGARQVQVRPGETVVVLGAGPIGLLHVQLARIAGARQVIVTNRSAHRRDLALRLGATRAVDPVSEDVRSVVLGATGGRGADVVVVAVGAADLAGQALALAGIGGRVSYFAGFPKGSTAEVDVNLIHYNELVVTGGSNARRADVVRAVDLLSAGVIDADALVTHRVPLSHFEEAIGIVSGRTGVKTAVVPG